MKKITCIFGMIFVVLFTTGCPENPTNTGNPSGKAILDWNRDGVSDLVDPVRPSKKAELLAMLTYYDHFYLWEDNDNSDKAVSNIDVSYISDMSSLFEVQRHEESTFNIDISTWDVSGVDNMSSMFCYAKSFDQPIGAWDVSGVDNMSSMFEGAKNFNQDISSWDVLYVRDMSSMFDSAERFNQDISSWVVANVDDMNSMFQNAVSFNQDISGWAITNVDNMEYMFLRASSFNQNLSGWYVDGKETYGMFRGTPMENRGEWHPSGCRCSSDGCKAYNGY